jgi:GNAT superfamily N-acetyltransferase
MRPLFEAIIAHMMSLQHEYALRPRSPVPPVISGKTEVARPPGDIRLSEVVVLTGALTESEWDKVRAFVRRTSRESLRLRVGQAADFADDHTLKRFFDIKGGGGEMIWILEEGGDICAIAHLVRPSSAQAEIALIVRTDCARRGIGEMLLRTTLARAARRNLGTLSALVLHENTATCGWRARSVSRRTNLRGWSSSWNSISASFNAPPARFWRMPACRSIQSKRWRVSDLSDEAAMPRNSRPRRQDLRN